MAEQHMCRSNNNTDNVHIVSRKMGSLVFVWMAILITTMITSIL